MERSVNLDSVSECQGTSENNGLERAVVAGIGKVPTFGRVFLIEDSCIITVKDTLTLSFGHKINFILKHSNVRGKGTYKNKALRNVRGKGTQQ